MTNKKRKVGSRKYSIPEEPIREIPEELIRKIFFRLPVNLLMGIKYLSKFCYSLISDPSFKDIHDSHSTSHPHEPKVLARSKKGNIFYTIEQEVEHEEPTVLHIEELDGAKYHRFHHANGLFCLWSMEEYPPAIYNPITKRIKYLPPVNQSIDDNITSYYYSFGFEPKEKNYKILMSSNPQNVHAGRGQWILTLGSGESWREIESAPCLLFLLTVGEVCIEGTIYFVGIHNRRRCIVAFNIKTEKFRIISLWAIFDTVPARRFYQDLIEVDEKLAVVDLSMQNTETVDLWILQSCETEEWIKHTIRFSNVLSSSLEMYIPDYFCSSTPGGEIVFISVNQNWIFFYDLKKKSWREIKLTKFAKKMEIIGIYNYVDTFLSCTYC